MSDDDRPVDVPIDKFKKLNKKRRFVDTLPDNLKDMYNEEIKKVLKPRDPRFDPKVRGSCSKDELKFYTEKQIDFLKEMKDKLSDVNLPDEDKAKCKLMITQLKQKQANQKQQSVKSKLIEDINLSYIKELEEGKFPKLLNKRDIKMKLKEHISSNRTAKSIEKSIKKKEFKKLKKATLLESKTK